MSKGSNYLARVITNRINEQLQRPDQIELGTMRAGKLLELDRFAYPLRTDQYRVVRQLTRAWWEELGALMVPSWTVASWPYDFDDLSLNEGDRVVVLWTANSTRPIVLDRFTEAS